MKPILFLDFDRTLFDTDLLYEWLGEDFSERIQDVLARRVPSPNFASMLYPDTHDFLISVQEKYTPVLLTYSSIPQFQELKVEGSGIPALLYEILITSKEKGEVIAQYFSEESEELRKSSVFIDDDLANLESVKRHAPGVLCVLMDRTNRVSRNEFSFVDRVVHDLPEFLEPISK